MKVLKLTLEQKRWAMTACLFATLSFNLSHLIEKPTEGEVSLASKASVDETYQEVVDRNEQDVRSSTAQPRSLPVAVPPTERPRRQNQEVVAPTAPVVQQAPVTQPTVSANSKFGVVKIGASTVAAKFTKIDDSRTLMDITDPNFRSDNGANCLDGRCGQVLIDIPFTNAVETLQAAAEVIIKNRGQGAKAADENLADMDVDKMTAKQKDKRADQLFEELEKRCEESSATNQLRCFTSGFTELLKSSDTKKIISESKASNFFDKNIRDRLKENISSKKFSTEATDLVDKMHRALPGKFSSIRESLISLSGEVVNEQASKVAEQTNKVRQLNDQAQRAERAIEQIYANSKRCTVDQYAYADCQQEIRDLSIEANKARSEAAKIRQDVSGQRSLLTEQRRKLRLENSEGLTGSRSYVTDEISRQLLGRYDDLTSRVLENVTSGSLGVGGRLNISQRLSSGTRQGLSQGVNNGDVRSFRIGEKLNYPSLSNRGAGIQNRNGSIPSNDGRIPAPVLNQMPQTTIAPGFNPGFSPNNGMINNGAIPGGLFQQQMPMQNGNIRRL